MTSTSSTVGGRIGLVTGIALAAATVVLGVATGAAGTTGWQKGLQARSEGLNARYGLGGRTLDTVSAKPGWQQGLRLRSEALNQRYGLGGIATLSVPSSRSQPTLRLHHALGALAFATAPHR